MTCLFPCLLHRVLQDSQAEHGHISKMMKFWPTKTLPNVGQNHGLHGKRGPFMRVTLRLAQDMGNFHNWQIIQAMADQAGFGCEIPSYLQTDAFSGCETHVFYVVIEGLLRQKTLRLAQDMVNFHGEQACNERCKCRKCPGGGGLHPPWNPSPT